MKYFNATEFLPPEVYHARGERGMELIDSRVVATAIALREKFGPMIINNWASGGNFTQRGFRSAGTATGAVWSQHKYGRALDCHFVHTRVEDARAYILANPSEFPFITCIEEDVSWLHFDCRNHNLPQQIMIVRPK